MEEFIEEKILEIGRKKAYLILFRTTDFAFLLRNESKTISDYSHDFRYGDLYSN